MVLRPQGVHLIEDHNTDTAIFNHIAILMNKKIDCADLFYSVINHIVYFFPTLKTAEIGVCDKGILL